MGDSLAENRPLGDSPGENSPIGVVPRVVFFLLWKMALRM